MSESASPEGAPLSVEAAIASLVQPPAAETEIQPQDAPEGEPEPEENTEGESSAPEEAEDGAETPAEEDPEVEAAEEPEKLQAPLYWKPEAKAEFARLSPEMQAVVLAQEGPREAATAKAKAEAAQIADAAKAELNKVNELATGLSERLPKWIEAFESRWGTQTPDWVALAQQHGVEAMTLAKTQYEAEQTALREAAAKTAQAQQIAHETFVKNEWQQLATIEPDLAPDPADPTKGADIRQKVTAHIVKRGIPAEAVAQISAAELSIAYDAMRWRESQALAKPVPKPKPAAPKAPVRPAASQAQPSPQRAAQAVANRFAQTRSVDDAVALLVARNT